MFVLVLLQLTRSHNSIISINRRHHLLLLLLSATLTESCRCLDLVFDVLCATHGDRNEVRFERRVLSQGIVYIQLHVCAWHGNVTDVVHDARTVIASLSVADAFVVAAVGGGGGIGW